MAAADGDYYRERLSFIWAYDGDSFRRLVMDDCLDGDKTDVLSSALLDEGDAFTSGSRTDPLFVVVALGDDCPANET